MTTQLGTSRTVRRGLRYNPYEHAEDLGIPVIHRQLRSANGLWVPEHGVIFIQSGLRALHDRSTLAHEIAHALLGHEDDRPKHEVAADRYAATLLIHPDECERAMRHVSDVPSLSLELQVSQRILTDYLSRRAG